MNRRLLTLVVLFASMFLGACAAILGIKKRDTSHAFEHRQHLIAGVNCLQCHAGVAQAGDGDPLHLPSTATCTGCHAKPHDPRPCGDCHGQARTRFAAEGARKHLRFEHKKHLLGLKGQCVPCHNEAGAPDPESLRPAMAQCFTCHKHEAQFALKNCNGCHIDLASEHVRPTSHVVHTGDFLREHGVRAATARDLCTSCHTESDCASCHGATTAILPWKLKAENPTLGRLHPAGFGTRHPEEAKAQPALCATCHSESSCASCHAAKKVSATAGGASPHPSGWVKAVGGAHGKAARLDPLGCASCHGGAGEMLCVGCHRVGGAGGNPHGPGFSSTRDKFKDDPCRLCHAP